MSPAIRHSLLELGWKWAKINFWRLCIWSRSPQSSVIVSKPSFGSLFVRNKFQIENYSTALREMYSSKKLATVSSVPLYHIQIDRLCKVSYYYKRETYWIQDDFDGTVSSPEDNEHTLRWVDHKLVQYSTISVNSKSRDEAYGPYNSIKPLCLIRGLPARQRVNEGKFGYLQCGFVSFLHNLVNLISK
jgi:hypothetical protein